MGSYDNDLPFLQNKNNVVSTAYSVRKKEKLPNIWLNSHSIYL